MTVPSTICPIQNTEIIMDINPAYVAGPVGGTTDEDSYEITDDKPASTNQDCV